MKNQSTVSAENATVVAEPKITTKVSKPNASKKIAETKTATSASKSKTTDSEKEKSTLNKVIAASKITSKIVTKAGGKILGTSIQTSKAIAGIYAKAGKQAFELGKELIEDTTTVMVKSQKNLRETSVEAFKETVETIKESHIIENPLKGILKSKKK